MKITVETTVGGAYNAETAKWYSFDAITVTAQAKKGGTRASTTFAFPGSDPVQMLQAATAFFKAQGPNSTEPA